MACRGATPPPVATSAPWHAFSGGYRGGGGVRQLATLGPKRRMNQIVEPGPGFESIARRLSAEALFEIEHDSTRLEADRAVARDEILRRADSILAEAEGSAPRMNHAVIEVFERHASYCPPGYPARGHRLWRLIEGVLFCATCHPPAHADLEAEWLAPREGDHPSINSWRGGEGPR